METSTRNILISATMIGALALGGCASTYEPPQIADEMVWSSDGDTDRPMWTFGPSVTEEDGQVLFVGMSDQFSTQKGARDSALEDVYRQVANYATTRVEDELARSERGQANQSGVIDPTVQIERVTRQLSVHAVNSLSPVDWRFEQWANKGEQNSFYTAFVRAAVPADSFDRTIDLLEGWREDNGEPDAE